MFPLRKISRRTVITSSVACAMLLSVSPFGLTSAMAASDAPFQWFNTIPVKADAYDSFLPIMRNNAKNTRQEAGNASFDVFADRTGGHTIYLLERWKSETGFQAHLKHPYLQAVGKALETANDGPQISVKLTEMAPTSPIKMKPIKDRAKTENIIQVITVKPGQGKALIAAFAAAMPALRATDGNIFYSLHQEQDAPDQFLIFQRWQDTQAFQAAGKTAAAKQLAQTIKPLLVHGKNDTRLMLRDISEAE